MTIINTAYEPGEPLKAWLSGDENHAILAELSLQAGEAMAATRRLLSDEKLSDADLISLGRANYHAFLNGFEPIFALANVHPVIDPNVIKSLRRYSPQFSD